MLAILHFSRCLLTSAVSLIALHVLLNKCAGVLLHLYGITCLIILKATAAFYLLKTSVKEITNLCVLEV